jgi:DNA-binding MarR family transcriptional regulator
LQLTEKGVNNFDQLDRINKEHQAMILECFSEEEARMFKEYLHRVLDHFWDWRNG